VGTDCKSALSVSLYIRAVGVEKLRLLNQLEEVEKKSIFTIIDMAITKKRLKDTLSNALNSAM
jgi:hypothetical protein